MKIIAKMDGAEYLCQLSAAEIRIIMGSGDQAVKIGEEIDIVKFRDIVNYIKTMDKVRLQSAADYMSTALEQLIEARDQVAALNLFETLKE